MAREPQESPEERVRKSVARTIANVTVLLLSLGVLGAWAYFGIYQLEPGQAAVILRFGKYVHTGVAAGPALAPAAADRGPRDRQRRLDRPRGVRLPHRRRRAHEEERLEAAMQTSDANIVHLSFVVQYRIKDAFQARYRIADPRPVLRDAAQAAVRGVVGRNTIDDVLSEKRGIVETETQEVLQDTLDHYESGLAVLGIELQDVQPPESVRAAFDDVLGAVQDRNRTVNEAQGYANEVLPKSRAQSVELIESARGYRGRAHRRSDRPGIALPRHRQRIPEGARGGAHAALPRNHGGRAAVGAHRDRGAGHGRDAVPAARRAHRKRSRNEAHRLRPARRLGDLRGAGVGR